MKFRNKQWRASHFTRHTGCLEARAEVEVLGGSGGRGSTCRAASVREQHKKSAEAELTAVDDDDRKVDAHRLGLGSKAAPQRGPRPKLRECERRRQRRGGDAAQEARLRRSGGRDRN